MHHVTGTPREQTTLLPEAIEDYVTAENPVRFIDAFVDKLDLDGLGFNNAHLAQTGRPPYQPGDLLKLYIYGYLNRIRSSRRLERETARNLEVRWLLHNLQPDHKTISDFRKDNRKGIQAVTRQFVILCQQLNLFGGELVAIDGSKFKASNSKKRNWTKVKLRDRIRRIDASIEEYLTLLEASDREAASQPTKVREKIASLEQRMKQCQALLEDLDSTGNNQVSQTDPDSRLMVGNGKADVGYNVQTAVDSKYKLIAACEVTNEINDRYQLAPMSQLAKEALGVQTLAVVADKGYATGTEIYKCERNAITAYVPLTEPTEQRRSGVPTPEYYHAKFRYDKERDCYICPQQHELHRKWTVWMQKQLKTAYGSPACRGCPVKPQCSINKNGRFIYRTQHEDLIEKLRARMAQEPDKLKERQCLSEHPFGTIKHGWGQGYFLLRGIHKVRVEISLSVLAYNIRRAISILGVPTLVKALGAA
jgi:transposase